MLPIAALLAIAAGAADRVDSGIELERISLPPGFEIAIYARGLRNPRSLALNDARRRAGSRPAGRHGSHGGRRAIAVRRSGRRGLPHLLSGVGAHGQLTPAAAPAYVEPSQLRG